MSFLLNLDFNLFRIINSLPHSSFWDNFMIFFSVIGSTGFPWLLILFGLLIFNFKANKKIILWGFLGLLIVSVLNEIILKPYFARPRPVHLIENIILVNQNPQGFSFPSGHAATSFFAALFLGLSFRRFLIPLIILASIISFSRVYLGYHYPLDILGGLLEGGIIGFLLWRWRVKNLIKTKREKI